MAELKIFSGNAHPLLAERVVDRLRVEIGVAEVGRFSDGEVSGCGGRGALIKCAVQDAR